MSKKIFSRLIITIFMMSLLLIGFTGKEYATNINFSDLELSEDLKKYFSNVEDINEAEIVELYTELTEQYSNQEIADMIDENKDVIIEKSGVDEKTLNTSTDVLRSLDTEETKKILKEDLNIEEVKEKLNNGYTVKEVIEEMQNEIPVSKVASISIRLLLASSIVKTILLILLVILLYRIIIRWIIFKKAGKHGWAAIIPIYNEITYLKVSGISPWWILILLIPIFGWIIYGIIKVVSRFTLAVSFKRGIAFGFGLLFFAIIFETVLAFNKNIIYIGDEEK